MLAAEFPEVLDQPEALLSRSFAEQHAEVWQTQVLPWLESSFEALAREARPTKAHHFCAWLHQQDWLRRVYTQNSDGLHTHPSLHAGDGFRERVVECHGSLRDGSIMLYGDSLPSSVDARLREDFGGESVVDLVLVLGTSLQVAPFCAIPNLAPRGAVRVLVNWKLSDALTNAWSKRASRSLDEYGGLYGNGGSLKSSMKLAGRAVTLRPLWHDPKRWQQLLVEDECDAFVTRFGPHMCRTLA